jgi:hypothetical protein
MRSNSNMPPQRLASPGSYSGRLADQMQLTETAVVIDHALIAALRSTIAALDALIVISFTHCRAARENERSYLGLYGQRGLYSISIVLDVIGLRDDVIPRHRTSENRTNTLIDFNCIKLSIGFVWQSPDHGQLCNQ